MADEFFSEEPQSQSRWLRWLAMGLGGLLVIMIAAYFVVSSAAFFKGVILPRVGKSLNADITVGECSISPFSRVSLTKLKVRTTGGEPLISAEQARVHYSLLSILRGTYVIDELTVASPTVRIVKEPSGASNLDPITNPPEGRSSAPTSTGPLRLAIRNVSFKDASLFLVEKAKDGSSKTRLLSKMDLTLERLENGAPGKLSLSLAMRLENHTPPGSTATNDVIEARINGSFQFKLDSSLLPQTISGGGRIDVSRAEGAYLDMAGSGGALQVEMTPTEVRQLVLRFERGGQALGKIQVAGPLDLSKSEGRLRIEVQSLNRHVLNLFGASRGWDFANSTLNATNVVDFARQGDVMGAKGQIFGRQMSIRQRGQSTPPVDLDIDYDVSLKVHDQTAVLKTLSITARQEQKVIARCSLDRPMTLAWAPGGRGLTESTFQVAIAQLNLEDLRSLTGPNALAGLLDLQLTVQSRQDGKNLAATGAATIQDFSARIGTNQIETAKAVIGLDGSVEDFKKLTIDQCQLELRQLGQPLLKLNGSGRRDLSQSGYSLQADAELALPSFLRQFPIQQLSAANGLVRVNAALTQANQKRSLTGNVSLADFTGSYANCSFQSLEAGLDYHVDLQGPEVQVHSASLTLRKGYTVSGNLELAGTYDLDKKSARLTFKAVDLNENVFGPLFASSLGDKKLVSISVSGSGTAAYDPKGETALKTSLSLTNWVMADPRKPSVSPALSAEAQLDGSMRQQIIDLRQFLLKLPPTAKAKTTNELLLKAQVDLSKTNASPSQMTVQSGCLDITPYYDLFAGSGQTNAPAAKAATSAAPGSGPPAKLAEPSAASLPLDQLTADVKIGRLYLRDLAVTNLQASAKLNRGELTLKPLELTVNGGSVSANGALNLGVAGYTYDMSLKADRVPLDALASSFSTNAPGQTNGYLIGQAQLKGAGLTDLNLKKNLTGHLAVTLTNMNYEIVGQKIKRLLEPVSAVLGVPELMQTPLNWVSAKAGIGNGQIDLQQLSLQSLAFSAETHGVIPLADVLTNSPLNLSVNLSLSRALAQRASLIPANSPTNTLYVALPNFVTLSGTLGDPKSEVKKLVSFGLVARSIGSLPQVGGKAGAILQQIGGVLTGQPAAANTNEVPSTNANATANLVESISSLLSKVKKGRTPTNAPATNTAVKPAKSNTLDLLNSIPEKK